MADITIDYSKIQAAVSSIDSEIKKLTKLFAAQDNNFKLLEGTVVWSGKANQNCLAKYTELSKQYEEIILCLDRYRNFLFNVGELYKSIEIATDKMASDI